MKFKVGDKVKVLPNLYEIEYKMKKLGYRSTFVTSDMVSTENGYIIIDAADSYDDDHNNPIYRDKYNGCWYNEWMLYSSHKKIMEIE